MSNILINKRIDILIPAYNVADKVLSRCLSSIACQSIVEDVDITIVDDASTEQNYKEVVAQFEMIMKIQILRYDTNGGPGVARQYGLDHTCNEFVMFIDADDTLNGTFALKALRNNIQTNNGIYQMCVGVFDEVHELELNANDGPILIPHESDMVWMFGKLYRRTFLNNCNIHFHPTSRANEDNGFNKLCQLVLDPSTQIKFIPFHVYYWHDSATSITRANNYSYSFGSSERDSFYGYIENMIFAIQEAKTRTPIHNPIIEFTTSCMVNIYVQIMECMIKSPDNAKQNFEWSKRFYNEVYKNSEALISEEMFSRIYTDIIRNAYSANKFNGKIPPYSVQEFLNKLKNGEDI